VTPRRTSIQLARVFGIRISVGISWFFVLFLYILFLHESLVGEIPDAFLVTVLSTLSFFVSLVVHELGHALCARRNGLQVAGIELWALGGITRTIGTTERPSAQFMVAAAGPFATVGVIVLCGLGAKLASPHQPLFNLVVESGPHASPVGVWLKVVAILNVLVLALNLMPAFPLDGGQIAQALIWKLSGDRNLATRATGRLGQMFAIALGATGLYLLAKGHSEGVWLALPALFIYQGAGAAVLQGALGQRIQKLTVADVMDREPITIPVEATLLDAQEQFFARYKWPWFVVIDSARHFIGVLRQERVDAELAAGRPALSVSEALEEDIPVRIGETQPLESLLRSEALGRLGGMVAVDGEGTLQGVVTLAQVRQALRPAS
jgi:Zn-dependent protease/CBS domain-containing protein